MQLWILAVWIACVVVLPSSPLHAMSKKEKAALERANSKWRGARCRNRIGLEVKKAKSKSVKCRWLFWGKEGGNERVLVMVSDGAAVHRAFFDGAIPPGTEFKALGWAEEKGDLILELELVEIPVRAWVYYYDAWVGRVGAGRLDEFERWAKYEFLELLSVPSEQLVDVPVGPAAHQPAPVAQPARKPPEALPTASAGPPAIGIVAVAVQPARVAPGAATELVINYDVSGVPPGPGFEVIELREIQHQGQVIASFEERLQRSNGNFPSGQPLHVPPGTAPGVYYLQAKVVMAGREASGTALFEVTAP